MKTRSSSRPKVDDNAPRRTEPAAAMADTRAASLAQRQHQQAASNSSQAAQLKARAELMAGRAGEAPVQRAADEELLQEKAAVQRSEDEELAQGKFVDSARSASTANQTGMPDQLKSGIEALSGEKLDHVKVHYNSERPAQLNAHAYAQGSQIYMAPGQEQHLPHEAWHVVQQMQGRVQPTTTVGSTRVNDNAGLEHEATAMGEQALQRQAVPGAAPIQLQKIAGIDVFVDGASYPVWTQGGIDWHLTMKDTNRWHVTKSDRSMSYWFTCDAGEVRSTKPTKAEFGGHKAKHQSLDDAPAEVSKFITDNISAIIKVTDKKK